MSKNTNELKPGAPPTFSVSLTQTPTMQELASVRRFLDGLCSGCAFYLIHPRAPARDEP